MAAEAKTFIVVGVVPRQPNDVVVAAATIATKFNAELVCAHVDQGRYLASEAADGTVSSLSFNPDVPELVREVFDQSLTEQVDKALSGTDVAWSVRELAGDPAGELARLANEVDAVLIVVGTRHPGFGGSVREFFSGSVAVHLAHRQHRPVVVVPLFVVHPDKALPWEHK